MSVKDYKSSGEYLTISIFLTAINGLLKSATITTDELHRQPNITSDNST